jgi:transposase
VPCRCLDVARSSQPDAVAPTNLRRCCRLQSGSGVMNHSRLSPDKLACGCPRLYACAREATWVLNQRDSNALVDAMLNPSEPDEALRTRPHATSRWRNPPAASQSHHHSSIYSSRRPRGRTRRQQFPFLRKLFADSAYTGPIFRDAIAGVMPALEIEIVRRRDGVQGFVVEPQRWIVERRIGWLNRCRRLARDWENRNHNALAFLRLMLRKLCNPS